ESHDDGGVVSLDTRPPNGPETTRDRLDERRGLVADVGRQLERRLGDVGGGHADQLGEASRIQMTLLEGAAHRLAAAPAVVALAARDVVGRDHAVADAESMHAGARLDDVTDQLVTEDRRGLGLWSHDLCDVGAAQAAAAQAQQQLAGADRRPWPVLGRDAALATEDGGLHFTARSISTISPLGSSVGRPPLARPRAARLGSQDFDHFTARLF